MNHLLVAKKELFQPNDPRISNAVNLYCFDALKIPYSDTSDVMASSVTAESPVASDDEATNPLTRLAEIGKAHEAVAVATQMLKAGHVRILE